MTHVRKILVSVGTHEQPFGRLLTTIASIAKRWKQNGPAVEWRVQTGPFQGIFPDHVSAFASCTHHQILEHISWADISLSQCSPGSLYTALEQTAQPLVVPRAHSAGEHVDDHQMAFADYVEQKGLAIVVRDVCSLESALRELVAESSEVRRARLESLRRESESRTTEWSKNVGAIVEDLVQRRARRNAGTSQM